MNLGLGNLTTLKRHLLPESLRNGYEFDDTMADLGKGVAALLEKQMSRKLGREEDATFIGRGAVDHLWLDRYPVESVSAVELKITDSDGWETQSDQPQVSQLDTGYMGFGVVLGAYENLIRVTFTGGYWFDDSEDGSETLPTGATALPEDIKTAWIVQCRVIWSAFDKLGTSLVEAKPDVAIALAQTELTPLVRETVARRKRYALL